MLPRAVVACGAVVVLAGLACKLSREGGERASETKPAPTSAPIVSPSPQPGLGVIPQPGAADTASDAERFAGPPGSDVKFMRVVTLRKSGVFLRTPVGWQGDAEHYDGLVQVFPKDESAVVMVNIMDASVGEATVALWTKSVGGRDVSYGPAEPGKLGKDSLAAQMAKGSGKLNKKDAEFWRFVVSMGGGTNMLVIAAVQKDATAEHRAELVACMRSLYKV